jgi:hypothetical protein
MASALRLVYVGPAAWAVARVDSPPGAADVALEQLAAATHKRPHNHHIVIIPRWYTSHWRRLLGKICDVVFCVPLGTQAWPETMFEPLLIGLYFPLLSFSPWQLQRTSFLDGVARQLSSLPRASHNWGGGDILCQLYRQTGTLATLSSRLARSLLQGDRPK